MENGVITDPSKETLNRLAAALEVDPEVLYESVLGQDPDALPSLPTYFRTKYRLSDEEIAEVQQLLAKRGRRPRAPKRQPRQSKTTGRRSS